MKKYTETLPNGTTFTMLPIAGGNFMMGNDNYSTEKPIHCVTVPDFYLGEYLVTQAVWEEIMGNNPSHFEGQQNPVESVSWFDVQAFIDKLNDWERQNPNPNRPDGYYCMPSEAQWGYAARGGNKSRGYKYAGSNDIDKVAWYRFNSGNRTHPVGQKQANELGLYDMTGNVWQWCLDNCNNYQVTPTDDSTFQEGKENHDRMVRGGSWLNYPNYCRVSLRSWSIGISNSHSFGCRLARCLTP